MEFAKVFPEARFGRRPPHPGDATMLMFVVGFVAAILINFFGWLLLAEARETEANDPWVSARLGSHDLAR
jgi:hypothetical protein